MCIQLKEKLTLRIENAPPAQQCLIFAGKVLNDDSTLESQGDWVWVCGGGGGNCYYNIERVFFFLTIISGVKSGVTIHLVVRSKVSFNSARTHATACSCVCTCVSCVCVCVRAFVLCTFVCSHLPPAAAVAAPQPDHPLEQHLTQQALGEGAEPVGRGLLPVHWYV